MLRNGPSLRLPHVQPGIEENLRPRDNKAASLLLRFGIRNQLPQTRITLVSTPFGYSTPFYAAVCREYRTARVT